MKASSFRLRLVRIVLLSVGIVAAAAIFVLLAKAGIGIGCPFHKLTGLQCPGCGNSRAVLSLLRLDFATAFRYNMMFLPELLYLLWVYSLASFRYIKEGRFSYKPPFIALDITLLVLIVLWGVVRNIFGI